jgi:methylated-DNA-[protein]-cysteine S-methyltransferase
MRPSRQKRISSKIGTLYLTASPKGLAGVHWKKQVVPMSPALDTKDLAGRILHRAERELTAYFAGRLKKFTIPLDPEGTPFQKRVWRALRQIPHGRTCSYRDIARRIRNHRAVRAVGSANGQNPLCVIVPCHRVVSSDGSIGGYSGGLSIKRALLALERPRTR